MAKTGGYTILDFDGMPGLGDSGEPVKFPGISKVAKAASDAKKVVLVSGLGNRHDFFGYLTDGSEGYKLFSAYLGEKICTIGLEDDTVTPAAVG